MAAPLPLFDEAQVAPRVFWTDRPDAPPARPALIAPTSADLVIVGGGFTGLWAALRAVEEQPGRTVVVIEAERCGFGASSRNGGFCDSSLTHGLAHGAATWPDEIDHLVDLGHRNLDELIADVDRLGIDADVHRRPAVVAAREPWQLAELPHTVALYRNHGVAAALLDGRETRAVVDSPCWVGGMVRPEHHALVDPARLAWGLAEAAEAHGVIIHDNTPAIDVEQIRSRLEVRTPDAIITAAHVIDATNAYRGISRGARRRVIPVYDHVLMTEPLSRGQLASIGWESRAGVSDAANQFHYFRLTEDDRILWGGYDATYHYGDGIAVEHELSGGTHEKLARHFRETFPQLEDLRFTHRWGGPIATSSRFTAAWGSEFGGRLVWVAGYTGLGVGASRFGARVALDLVDGRRTERTELEMVRRPPFPFPPEPLRSMSVAITKRAIQRSDRRQGRRGPWLWLLDRFGIGFDS